MALYNLNEYQACRDGGSETVIRDEPLSSEWYRANADQAEVPGLRK